MSNIMNRLYFSHFFLQHACFLFTLVYDSLFNDTICYYCSVTLAFKGSDHTVQEVFFSQPHIIISRLWQLFQGTDETLTCELVQTRKRGFDTHIFTS